MNVMMLREQYNETHLGQGTESLLIRFRANRDSKSRMMKINRVFYQDLEQWEQHFTTEKGMIDRKPP
jgi:hypothetical protein